MGFALQPEEGKLVWAAGALINGKAIGENTGGLFELLELTGPEGFASPLHSHVDEAEAFYVLEGQVYLVIGDEEIKATSGWFGFVPAKEKHAFRVDSPTAKFLMGVVPARLLPFFEEVGEPALSATMPPPSDPPDPERLAEVAIRHGMEILGPPPGAE